ncbi:hypothetical protein JI735_34240 (plasmid) [Paenibacillus sonchi]|uniref:Uncharacterized protein n=1 Tax=Paenibacillus sonchi TaxID=373687 RepID=A0A974PIJ9_9BACL|nr:hypothetical protein [Paenibacillus sonchi]QQZ64501.1 hypothetical protein JI735_34240 [Paenibacillus sonchi]
MGTSWEYFKRYEIKPDEDYGDDIIHYIDNDSLNITYSTSSQLASIIEHFGIQLPVYDVYEPPKSKILNLVDPLMVARAASKGIELLESEINPFVKSLGSSNDLEHLFSPNDIDEYHTAESLNERISSYLKKMVTLSISGHYFVRSND